MRSCLFLIFVALSHQMICGGVKCALKKIIIIRCTRFVVIWRIYFFQSGSYYFPVFQDMIFCYGCKRWEMIYFLHRRLSEMNYIIIFTLRKLRFCSFDNKRRVWCWLLHHKNNDKLIHYISKIGEIEKKNKVIYCNEVTEFVKNNYKSIHYIL